MERPEAIALLQQKRDGCRKLADAIDLIIGPTEPTHIEPMRRRRCGCAPVGRHRRDCPLKDPIKTNVVTPHQEERRNTKAEHIVAIKEGIARAKVDPLEHRVKGEAWIGFTVSETALLRVLSENVEMTTKEVVGLARRTRYYATKRLQERGFLYERLSLRDARLKVLTLTQLGQQVCRDNGVTPGV